MVIYQSMLWNKSLFTIKEPNNAKIKHIYGQFLAYDFHTYTPDENIQFQHAATLCHCWCLSQAWLLMHHVAQTIIYAYLIHIRYVVILIFKQCKEMSLSSWRNLLFIISQQDPSGLNHWLPYQNCKAWFTVTGVSERLQQPCGTTCH